MVLELTRRRFTTAEYARMAEVGVLGEDDRLELIDGEILELAPIGSAHAACVRRMTGLFARLLSERVQVSIQNPIDLDEHTQPQPDLVLLLPRNDFYATGHPTAADILLLVEVAETSDEYDRQIKVPLYARHGINEVWLVDLRGRRVFVCTVIPRPTATGQCGFASVPTCSARRPSRTCSLRSPTSWAEYGCRRCTHAEFAGTLGIYSGNERDGVDTQVGQRTKQGRVVCPARDLGQLPDRHRCDRGPIAGGESLQPLYDVVWYVAQIYRVFMSHYASTLLASNPD
jgi:Uma2 family endonuclease